MKFFAQSTYSYIENQIARWAESGGKLMLMAPSMPAAVVLDVGLRLTDYSIENASIGKVLIKVAAPLVDEWLNSPDRSIQKAAREVIGNKWRDDNENLTCYRNLPYEGEDLLVILLIGINRITDSSSMADFHHCDLHTIWKEELKENFSVWIQAKLKENQIGYEENDAAVKHFNMILHPLIERGLADIIQISELFDDIDLSAAQDGRDALKVLLSSLSRFRLPNFSSFRFANRQTFGPYIDSAISFFNYTAYREEKKRQKALKTLEDFVDNMQLGEIFSPDERKPFCNDQEFIEALKQYIREDDRTSREKLLQSDFVVIHDRLLKFKPPQEPKHRKETVVKLSGSPIEMILNALWITLGDFKKNAMNQGLFAHEALNSICITSTEFKHDCDGESPQEKKEKAGAYLTQLLGGVDRFVEKWIDTSRLNPESRNRPIQSELLNEEIAYKSAGVAEPSLRFKIIVKGEGLETAIENLFAWRLPETHSYRVANEILRWGAEAVCDADAYHLPVFFVPYYVELMQAKDGEEILRVLHQCINDREGGAANLFKSQNLDPHDCLLPLMKELAHEYKDFIQRAKNEGLHTAIHDRWDKLRKAYEKAIDACITDPEYQTSNIASMLFRSFLIVNHRWKENTDRWMWAPYEPSGVVTVLHPALLEMLHAQILYLLTSFTTIAAQELKTPGIRSFRDSVWQNYVDLATIQTPLSGLLKNSDRILDTDVRGENLVFRIGNIDKENDLLTTRLRRRYDSFDDEDISNSEMFRESRDSTLLYHILSDYRKIHPHAEDGLSIAVYQNKDIQPIISAINKYLFDIHQNRIQIYWLAVTIFTETSDDSSALRWISQWKERWEAAENQDSLNHYRQTQFTIAHRIVSQENNYSQFTKLITDGLEVDIAILNEFIRAGKSENRFDVVEPYDVTKRTLKFPILEKAFCATRNPANRLQRARILSNRQFRLSTLHAELMARLKNPEIPSNSQHVVLGYGDYTPWQEVVDALHQQAEWVVCIDPNIDERLIAEKRSDAPEKREIIGFGSGVGSHGEANYTISTEQFRLSDIFDKLIPAIQEVYGGWPPDSYPIIAQSVLAESQRLSGLSLVKATGVGTYIHDFMAYSLTRKLLRTQKDSLFDQFISLDAYRHWFDFAETNTRPDLLWITANIGTDGRFRLDMRLIECKLAQTSDSHLEKARDQLENGLRRLIAIFMPCVDSHLLEDENPDQRYWWLQLHRLIASNAEIDKKNHKRVLTALERLAEGDFDIEWRATAIAYWTDQKSNEISQKEGWSFSFEGREFSLGIASCGTEFIRILCERGGNHNFPWNEGLQFFSASNLQTSDGIDRSDSINSGDDVLSSEEIIPDVVMTPGEGATIREEFTPQKQQTNIQVVGKETPKFIKIPDRILLGVTTSGNRPIYWEFGHNELNNRHVLIFGSSGMGKTYTIQCLLAELGQNGQNSLIVDYSKGFSDEQLEEEFKNRLKPLQHLVLKKPLAINPFRQQGELIDRKMSLEPPITTAQRVSGVFSEVYNFGDQQKSALYQAIKSGLEQSRNAELTLKDLKPCLEKIEERGGVVGQGAGSVISKILPFIDQNPFGEEDPDSWERLFTDSDCRCHVVQLAGFMKDPARLITEFSLIDLYWFYRSHGTQNNPRVIVLDEVQYLDHREESPLAQLLREGRKFGFSLILATQIMSNLNKDEKDRLFNAAHKLFFRPADTEMRTYAEIISISAGEKVDAWMNKLAALKKSECYSLGPSLNQSTNGLETKAFKIRIASLEDRIANA